MDTYMTPAELRGKFRAGAIAEPTSGMCPGYAQANLVILPEALAYDFLVFTEQNPKSCPVLEVSETGSRTLSHLGNDIDIATDFPLYRVYEKGVMIDEPLAVTDLWRDDLVSFLIGCSFSFEEALLDAGVPIRNIEENCNVPMYITNIPCKSSGLFSGNMVVSMRPIPEKLVNKAVEVTGSMPRVHGAPVHIGAPGEIGIKEIEMPDFGDAVTIKEGEIPVFWACGVTPQAVVMAAKPDFVITHAPGHMLVTDILNKELM